MNTKTLLYVLGTAVIFCSCVKEADKSPETVQSTEVIIHATMAGNGNTKTVLQENGSVFWQPGDQIAVFFNSVKVPFTSYNSVDAASAYFVGNLDFATAHNEGSDGAVAGEYKYLGLYPLYIAEPYYGENHEKGTFYWTHNRDFYNMYYEYTSDPSTCSCSDGIVTTALLPWQRGVEDTFDEFLNIALAQSDDYHELSFYNVLGGIRFSVQSSDIIRVTFRSNNSESLAGEFSVKMDAGGKPAITDVSIPYDAITVSLYDDRPFTPGKWYYMMMFPGVLSKGYTMEFYTAKSYGQKVVNSSVEVKRSVFGSLQNPDDGVSYEPLVHATSLDIKYDGYSIELTPGDAGQLEVALSPADCTFPLIWSSSNPDVVTVDENGFITAVAEGNARISVSCDELEDSIWIYVVSDSSEPSFDSPFEIVSVDLSGADALAVMPMPEDVIDTYRSYDDKPTCIYKIDEDGNAEPLKFTFSSSNSVLEQKLNESALVYGRIYWMTDRFLVIDDVYVYCSSAFGEDPKHFNNSFTIRLADDVIFKGGWAKESHWYTQRLSGAFRWSYDNAYLYCAGSYDYPFYRLVQSGNQLVSECLLDFSSSSFDLSDPSIIIDKNNNLAYVGRSGRYVFFADGGMADIPRPEKDGECLFVENSYNWYLFVLNDGVSVYQVVVDGHDISLVEKATNVDVSFDRCNIIKNDDVIVFVSRYDNYKLTFNPQTNELVYSTLPEGIPAYYYGQYNAFGVGYALANGVLTEYDLVNETIRTIDTDRSQVPQMTATSPRYDAANNCFYETGTRYSDTKTITVVTNCSTGKVTVYEGAYETLFKSYLKL